MLLEIFGFLQLSFTDILDIFLVGLIIYMVIRWMKGTPAMNLIIAIFFIYLIMLAADALHMRLLSRLVSTFVDIGVIALVIIFQPEIRHFLMKFGANQKGLLVFRRLFNGRGETLSNNTVMEICDACSRMSKDKTGALIVIPHTVNLQQIIETGDQIDAKVSQRLIMNIFFKNSPLHDGAMIISGDRIVAARCTLPITQKTDIPAHFGMRHKAAIGITEESDADVIVVSEETGTISFVKGGEVEAIASISKLKLYLGQSLSLQE